MNKIIINKINDKYFKNYKYLFNYTFLKFNYINKILLYNFIWNFKDNTYFVCKYNFPNYINKYYDNIILKSRIIHKYNIKKKYEIVE